MNNWEIMAPHASVGFKPGPGAPALGEELLRVPGVKKRGVGWLVPGNAIKVIATLADQFGVDLAFAKWLKHPPPTVSWEYVEAKLRAGGEMQEWVLDGFLTLYQKDATAFGWPKAGVHFWHSTGAGKTLTAIMTSLSLPGPVIAVTRASARLQFAREIERFTTLRPYVIRPEGERRGLMTVGGETWVDFFKRRMPELGKAALVAEEWKAAKASHGVAVKKGSNLLDYLKECSRLQRRPIIVVGWESLVNHLASLEQIKASSVIFDECFPGDVTVVTKEGEKPIREVQEGDLVLSVDVGTGEQEWKPVLRNIRSAGDGRLLIEVRHDKGVLVCTPNHRVWTLEEGYVEAGRLLPHHHLRPLRDCVPAGQEGQGAEVLFPKVLGAGVGRPKARPTRDSDLCLVQRSRVHCAGELDEEILWDELCLSLEGDSAPCARCVQGGRESGPGTVEGEGRPPIPSRRSPCCFASEDEGAESDEKCCDTGEGQPHSERDWSQAALPGREWNGTYGVRSSRFPGDRAESRSCGHSEVAEGGGGHAQKLQDRPGVPGAEGGDRDRRGVAQQPDEAVSGQEEGAGSLGARVVSVEVHEQQGAGRLGRSGAGYSGYLYDLEVEGNHNYFVNGVLVSNCHQGKSGKRWEVVPLGDPEGETDGEKLSHIQRMTRDAKKQGGFVKETEEGMKMFLPVMNRAAAGASLARKTAKRIGTTATPIKDRVRDLWSQLDIIEPNAHGNKTTWENRHADRRPGAYGGYDTRGSSRLDELNMRLETIAHVLTYAQTHSQLPPKRRQSVYITPEDQCRPTGGFAKERKAAKKRGATAVLEVGLAEAASRKRPAVLGIVDDHVRGGQKVVLFTGRRRDCEALGKSVKNISSLKAQKVQVWVAHGGQSQKLRDQIVQDYMAHPGPCVLVGTGPAFGESLNIDDTDAALFVMLPYTPGQLRQWEGRFHRASSKKPVIIYYVIAEGTVDEHMAAILIDKLPAVEKVVKDDELAEAAGPLAGYDPNESEEEFAESILADLDFG